MEAEPKPNPADSDLKLAIPDDWLTSHKTMRNPHTMPAAEEVPTARQFGQTQEIKPDGKRKHMWLIDIAVYPFSLAGTIQLACFIGVPLVILVLGRGGPLWIIYAYMAWYACECVRESAAGGIRAPDVIANSPSPGDAFEQFVQMLACCVLFSAPPVLYLIFGRRDGTIFLVLLACSVFIFPMGLLSVLMFDSLRGLNPVLLIGSIASVFFSYCAMIIGLAAAIFLLWFFVTMFAGAFPWQVAAALVFPYALLVAAHLLGRFYFRNAAKLNWEV